MQPTGSFYTSNRCFVLSCWLVWLGQNEIFLCASFLAISSMARSMSVAVFNCYGAGGVQDGIGLVSRTNHAGNETSGPIVQIIANTARQRQP